MLISPSILSKRRKRIFRTLDRHALFWNTVLGALQASALITLGRVFDQDTPHNVDVLIRVAQETPTMFSKSALARRKHNSNEAPPAWLEGFVTRAHEPTAHDFRYLRKYVKKLRRIYEARYRDLRHKVFAHTVATGPAEVAALAANANINELKRLISSLLSLHETLFDLFWNGRPPVLRKLRYAAKLPEGHRVSNLPHEQIVAQAEQVLMDTARPNKALQATSRVRAKAPVKRVSHASRG